MLELYETQYQSCIIAVKSDRLVGIWIVDRPVIYQNDTDMKWPYHEPLGLIKPLRFSFIDQKYCDAYLQEVLQITLF